MKTRRCSTDKELSCIVCNTKFFASSHQLKHGNPLYCSKKCFYHNKSIDNSKIIECIVCKKQFRVKNSTILHKNIKCCSRKCSDLNRKNDKEYNCKCLICGKEFYAYPSTIKNGLRKYCSKNCYYASKIKEPNCKCIKCGKEIHRKPSQIISNGNYCSVKCFMSGKTGALCYRWKGGVTKESILQRASSEYKIWRISVFKRDLFTCQHCGSFGEWNLNAHHIIPFSADKSLRFDVNNGITLCVKCHKLEHLRLSKKNNKQIDVFETRR